MMANLRACLWLLVLTVLICCVLYPLALWGVGKAFFPSQAAGSLVYDENGQVIGSRLIAQPFTGDEWFQPRPSAVSYNASGSGASNWGANNPLLRDRVARQLGPIVKYAGGPKKGQPVGPDVEAWFREKPDRTVTWAKDHPALAANWAKSDDLIKAYVTQWAADHPELVAEWKKDNPDKEYDPTKPEDIAGQFFASYARAHPGTWPAVVETKSPDGKAEKKVQPVREGSDIQAVFFDPWLQEHSSADLEKVPADMVMASGSGLDPHITLKNARYQLDRVAATWVTKTKADASRIRQQIEALVEQHAFAPMWGLVGGDRLVNVLELNLALKQAMQAVGSR
jgi:K+-transporting ATPase ATPase C chain